MTPLLTSLIDLAYRSGAARDANDEIERAREEADTELAAGTSYELMIDPEQDEPALRAHALEAMLPRLIYFVTSRRTAWPQCNALVVSLFAGDTLYFVRGEDFARWLIALSGETPERLRERYGV